MSHEWHDDNLEGCTDHARQFATSCLRVLEGDRIQPGMQRALAEDIRNVVEDLDRITKLLEDLGPDLPRDSYVQRLEGVVFVQLHQIQQLRKEVARHAAPA
jgi:hypothetical protein